VGSHHKKKKKTTNIQVVIADIKQDQDEALVEAIIHQYPDFDTAVPEIRSQVDFVNVTETIDPSQSTS
jgi:hypothetical protein